MTHFVSLLRDGEAFAIAFVDGEWMNACRVAHRWANDPTLRFSWDDALAMGRMIRDRVGLQECGGK